MAKDRGAMVIGGAAVQLIEAEAGAGGRALVPALEKIDGAFIIQKVGEEDLDVPGQLGAVQFRDQQGQGGVVSKGGKGGCSAQGSF